MRVKVGGEWYDSKDDAICIEVSEVEQEHIAAMDRNVAPNGRYASFPDGWDIDAARAWIEE